MTQAEATSRHIWRDLPGERSEDAELLRSFVDEVRVRQVSDTRERNLALGRLVLETFFASDQHDEPPEALYGRRRERHVSFQALRRWPDPPASYNHLNQCVRVLLQQPHLPEAARDALPFSHLKALLRLPHGRAKGDLARRAHTQNWTERRLQAEVAAARERLGLLRRTGRRPITRADRITRQCEALLEAVDAEPIAADEVRALRPILARLYEVLGELVGGGESLVLSGTWVASFLRGNARSVPVVRPTSEASGALPT